MSYDYRVYIPTRNRIANVEQVVPRWLAHGFDVVLVTDPREKQKHIDLVQFKGWFPIRGWQRIEVGPKRSNGPHTEHMGKCGVTVIAPPEQNAGFGYQCDYARAHAVSEGIQTFVLSDDDLMPKPDRTGSQYMQLLVDELHARPDFLGMGARRSYHDLGTRGLPYGPLSKLDPQVVLCPAGWGQQCYALNSVPLAKIGGFDEKLTCFGEGHEIIRRSLRDLGRPWLVHAGVEVVAIGKRYAVGGLDTYADEIRSSRKRYAGWTTSEVRTELERQCKMVILNRWPNYITEVGNVQWKKLHDSFLPAWQTFSALHTYSGDVDAADWDAMRKLGADYGG